MNTIAYDDADDLDAPPLPPRPKYVWPECEPDFSCVRGDRIISSEQFEFEKSQIASGEKTMTQIFAEYGLNEWGRKGPNYVQPRRQS
ncbi:hypothetical protein DyAD56_16285 [Dyella sp. AD56]|uniref:hypothetical protein n=1 Tax=Dyella sp. AD56 TaxID=1528744 RepID=UPI000C82F2AB|nr:hypothetical protein [Dyella sp. AD56]PMQ04247.1 hypothetical protein DyAD56_16285 [Dyella sp. AD56]